MNHRKITCEYWSYQGMLAVNVAKIIKAEENSGAECNLKLQNQGSGEMDE